MNTETKTTGLTREGANKAFLNIIGDSVNRKYTKDGYRYAPSEYKLPALKLRSNKYVPTNSIIRIARFEYWRDLYKFQVYIDIIFSKKPTKQIRNERNYKSLQYAVLKWFDTNGNEYIKGYPGIDTTDIYLKIINDIKFLNNGS